MKNRFTISASLLALMLCMWSFGLQAQEGGGEKYRITFGIAPSLEWLRFPSGNPVISQLNNTYGTKFSYNFAAEYQHYLTPNVGISLGVQYQNKGFRNETTYFVLSSGFAAPEEDIGVTLGSVRYLSFPLLLHGHIPLARRSFLSFSGGAIYGRLLSQTINNRNYSADGEPVDGVSLFDLDNGRSNIDLFSDTFWGLQFGAGYSRHIRSRIVIDIHPSYRFQLNSAFSSSANTTLITTPRLNSFAFEVKAGYYFSKQIDRTKKEF